VKSGGRQQENNRRLHGVDCAAQIGHSPTEESDDGRAAHDDGWRKADVDLQRRDEKNDQCCRDALIYQLSARRVHHVFGKHGFHALKPSLG
jgi:hypothetical protein